MPTALIRRCALLGVFFAFLLTTAAPALAQTYRHTDARRDVAMQPQGKDFSKSARRDVDIKYVTATNGKSKIRIAAGLRSTAFAKNIRMRVLNFDVKTPTAHYEGKWLEFQHKEHQFILMHSVSGRQVQCSELRGTTNQEIWWSVNRSCFHNPKWIRVTVSTTVVLNNGNEFFDNGQSDKWRDCFDLDFSPRIQRG